MMLGSQLHRLSENDLEQKTNDEGIKGTDSHARTRPLAGVIPFAVCNLMVTVPLEGLVHVIVVD